MKDKSYFQRGIRQGGKARFSLVAFPALSETLFNLMVNPEAHLSTRVPDGAVKVTFHITCLPRLSVETI